MDRYQQIASGEDPDAQDTEGGGKITEHAAIVLIVVSFLLDILSIADTLAAEIPIADGAATIFSLGLLSYFIMKGIPSVRPFLTWLAGYLAEWIPFVDYLPFYMIGIIVVIAADRNRIAAKAIQYLPSKNLATKGAGAAAGRTAARLERGETALAKNRVFGAASEKYQAQAVRLQERIPGRLRSVPGTEEQGIPLPPTSDTALPGKERPHRIQRGSARPSTPDPTDETLSDDREKPFPDTYYRVERELLPDLDDLMDVDVTGERAAAPPPSPAASGKAAPKRVQ